MLALSGCKYNDYNGFFTLPPNLFDIFLLRYPLPSYTHSLVLCSVVRQRYAFSLRICLKQLVLPIQHTLNEIYTGFQAFDVCLFALLFPLLSAFSVFHIYIFILCCCMQMPYFFCICIVIGTRLPWSVFLLLLLLL